MSRCQLCATRSLCIVGGVSTTTTEMLAAVIQEQPFHKSELLQKQGEVADTIAIVKLGSVIGTRLGPDAIERPVALFGRGQLMGAYGLLGQRNQLGGRALSPGRMCVISIADLYRLGVMDRQFLGSVYTRITQSVGRLADWSQVMRVKGIQQQLLLALQLIARGQGNPLIRLPSHVALAALLSTTRESVARNLRQLERQGLLVRQDRWHCLLAASPGLGPDHADSDAPA